MRVQLASLIADGNDLQAVFRLEPARQIERGGIRLRLRKDELAELIRCEGARAVKDGMGQVIVERAFVLLVYVPNQLMPVLELAEVDIEPDGGPLACIQRPAVTEQHPANVQEQEFDRRRQRHGSFPQRCQRICRDSNGLIAALRPGTSRTV